MPGRRLEDRVATLLLVPAGPGVPRGAGIGEAVARTPRAVHSFQLAADRTDLVVSAEAVTPDALGAIFAVRVSRDDVLLISGDEQVLFAAPEEAGASSPRLAAAATTVRRARARSLKRCASRDAFLLLSERLSRAQSTGEVVDGLLQHLPSVVDGFAAAVALRSTGSDAATLKWRSPLPAAPGGRPLPGSIPAQALTRLSISGVLTSEGCAEDQAVRGLAELMEEAGAAKLAFAGLGESGALLLLERRPDREFEADDWHLLGLVARQAEDALIRIGPQPTPGSR